MDGVLFIHSPNLHEAHRMFAESIGADFEPAYPKELTGLRRFLEAFKRAKEYPDYPFACLKVECLCSRSILRRFRKSVYGIFDSFFLF